MSIRFERVGAFLHVLVTCNTKRYSNQELRIINEWNPHFRRRRLWWLWRMITPTIVLNAWI